jgi:monovalent cation:H+ antiporter-2, CPA2 family
MESDVLQDAVILLALSVLTVAVFRRLRLPPIIGYMFVGVVAGPPLLGWLGDNPTTHFLGEIGVMFLLFTLGLELPLAQLNRMKGSLLGLGGAQVLIGTLSGAVIALAIGIPWEGALVLGGALALSSTAIVTKELMNRLELQTRHGQLALGVLLFQDLAAVPFLVMTPILAAEAAVHRCRDGSHGSPLYKLLTLTVSTFSFQIRQGLAQHHQCRSDLRGRHFAPAKYMILQAIYEHTCPDPLARFQG